MQWIIHKEQQHGGAAEDYKAEFQKHRTPIS